MKVRIALLAAVVLTGPVSAQEMESAPGGILRLLDKITGNLYDLDLSKGQSAQQGRLLVQLDDCRFPKDNPASDAQAHVTVTETDAKAPVFSGWMLASSPALSAMDHPRYDLWVITCDSGYVAPEVEEPVDTPEEPIEEINEG